MKISISAQKPTLKELEAQLKSVLAAKERSIHLLKEQRENPSVRPLYESAVSQSEVITAILDYMHGNKVMLTMMGNP